MQNLSLFESNSQPFIIDNHLSFNFHDYTIKFQSLTETKSYTPITGCVLEHILTTTNLTNYEKCYYLLADSLSIIGKSQGGNRSCALPSEDWADRLGCSRSLVFAMQKSLVKKGYFIVNKDFDKIGRNKRNLITPTLPASVFNHLNEKFSDKVGEHASYNPLADCKRSYLDRTKLFIKLNYRLLLTITKNLQLNSLQKIIWLGFYTRCYKNYILQAQSGSSFGRYAYNNDADFFFISSYRELAKLYSCNIKHLSKSIKALEQLGFIKLEHLYIRKKYNYNNNCDESYNTNNCKVQERQDQSLWRITLSLPKECILELEKVKNRSSFKANDTEMLADEGNFDSKPTRNYLILGGAKLNLTLEQASLLKSALIVDDNLISDHTNTVSSFLSSSGISLHDTYINSLIEELDSSKELENSVEMRENIDLSDSFSKTTYSIKVSDNKGDDGNRIKSDPSFAKSALLLNKDLILKIKDIKSNLRAKPKVIFNNFLKKFRKEDKNNDGTIDKETIKKQKSLQEFNICSELIREKLKTLPRDKADKARKFAYSLISKKIATGYAASLNKHELAKQLIHHAATWKPTKLGSISRDQEIDTALSVAWKSIVKGTWQSPLEYAKAEILNYEYRYYRKKYQESGVLSYEIKSLESAVNGLLGGWYNLEKRIIAGKSIDIVSITNDTLSSDTYQPCRVGFTGMNESRKTYLFSTENYNLESNHNSLYPSELEGGNHLTAANYISDYSEEKQNNTYNLDISNITEEQRHLKITPSDQNGDDNIKFEAINGKEYFLKLKMLELNDDGDLVMTLKRETYKSFLEFSTSVPALDKHDGNIASCFTISNKNLQPLAAAKSNIIEPCKNEREL